MPARRVLLVPLLLASLAWLTAAVAVTAEDDVPTLEDFYRDWRAGAAPLMSPAEGLAWDSLSSDRERELFIRAFWGSRQDRSGAVPRLEEWWRRFLEAKRRFGGLDGDRARAMLLAGVPAREQVFGGCRGVLRPLRAWRYDAHQSAALGLGEEGFDLVFLRDYDAADGLFRAWSPADGYDELSEDDAPWRRDVAQILAFSRERHCFRTGESEAQTLETALRGALALEDLAARAGGGDDGWLEGFGRRLEKGELRLPGGGLPGGDRGQPVAIGFPGRDASKMLVLGRLEVPVAPLERGAAGQLFDRLRLLGEVRRGSWLVDGFEHTYHLIGPSPSEESLELDFYRRLRPGDYLLRLRLEDASGLALLRRDLELRVPALEDAPRVGDEDRPAGAGAPLRELTRRRVVSVLSFPGLEILPLSENAFGRVELRLVATGGAIDRVEVEVDGAAAGSDRQPPYAVTVDLGETPSSHRVEATAYDASGRAVARATHRLEPTARPLSIEVRRRGEKVEAGLGLPRGEVLESLQIYLDGLLLESFTAPPFETPLPAGAAGRYLRATVTTASGLTAEDLVLLDPGAMIESVDVRWVEVYATVLDASGRPVTGLEAGDFRLLEEGAPRPLVRFDRVENLPLQVILAMDTSESMRDSLETAVESARHFFTTVLTDKDRAALVTFNHDLRLAVPFTADVARLHLGASGLAAWGGTRLHDAVAFSSGYVGGHGGRRALVLLSDGRDVESDFTAAEAREHALRAGLVVYPILLGVRDRGTRGQLQELARASGGRAFTIRDPGQLDAVYRQIEEDLRSQYLLVYEAPEGGEPGSFRRIDIEMAREGLRPRALRGYYR